MKISKNWSYQHFIKLLLWTTKFWENQTSKIVSQMWICFDEYVVQFFEITKYWSSDSISLQDLLIGIVIFDPNTKYPSIWLKNRSKTLETELQQISGYKLVRNSLFYVHSSCYSHVFFVFKGLWWKFFGVFGAWILRASLIPIFLEFLEAFGLDSSKL